MANPDMINDNPKTILLVEDEAIIAMMEKQTLEKYGYNVIYVNTGEKAVQTVQGASGIDLILMDIDLGRGMDGTEAAEIILREHDLPLVFLSSHIEPEIVEKTEGITSYGYIVKNTGETVLIASIKMAFRLFEVKKKDEAKEKELFLQSLILDQIHDNVTVTDFEGNIMYVNSAVVDMLGRPREQILNQSIEIYGEDPGQGASQKEILAATLRDGSWQGEVVNYNTDGEVRILLSRTQTIHDQHGNPIALCGVSSDVTVQKQTEERMRVMSEMLDNAPSSITVHDSGGRFLYANRKTFDIHGYEEADFMSKNLSEIDIPESSELFAKRVRQIEENREASFEVGHYRKDGSVLSLEVVAKKVSWGGQPAILSIATDITARKQIEESLKEKTRLLQNITDNMFDLVALTDPLGFFTFVGRSHQILGYDLDSLIGRNAMEFVHPDDLPGISAAFEESLTTGRDNRKSEYRYRCADGSYIWLETVGRFINDENGNVVELLFSSRDVTDRKKVEESLRESEQKYRLIFENSPLGLLHFDSEGVITACNDNFVGIIGSSREALIGLNMCTLPDSNIVAAVKDALEGRNGFYEDNYHSVTAKKVTPIRALFTTIRDNEGNFLGGTGIIEDVTERWKTEAALRESESFKSILLESLPVPVFNKDAGGLYQGVNRAFENFFGVGKEKLVGKSVFDINPPEFARTYQEKDAELFSQGGIQVYESQVRNNMGEIRDVVFHKAALTDASGKVTGLIGAILDITERKRAEEKLRVAEDMYRNIFMNSQIGLFRSEVDTGVIVDANDAFAVFAGFSDRVSLLEASFNVTERYIDPVQRNRIIRALKEGGEVHNFETRFRKNDDTIIWIRFSAKYNKDKGWIEGVAEDITDWKGANDALRESEERYRLLFQYSPLGIYVADRDGNILDANERLLAILGSPSLEATKKINVLTFPVLIESGYSDAFKECVDSNTIAAMEFRYTSLWGKTTFASNYLVPVADDSGKVVKVFTLIEDITARKQNEERIKSLLDEKELLLKETHHRIKNNMNVVYSLLQLQANRVDNGVTKGVLDDAAGRVQSMAVLYDKLYRSDIQNELSMKDFLPSLIEEIIAVTPGAVPVTTDIRIEDIVVSAKILSSLGILLNELITNSMKYAFKDLEEGQISVSAVKKDNVVTITYRDNGAGLPEDVTLETSQGFGMQLINLLVRQIKGTVEIIREHGTGFVIRF
ncbi:MAG TPA: PAS domain S-box protein [Spirochaetota bacterium]|nr:PAS domain S-box protein [Spirochaetota bacterium]